MENLKNLFKRQAPPAIRKLHDQIEALNESRYYEYFSHILNISKARDVTEITEGDIEAYMTFIKDTYYYPIRIRDAAIAIRHLLSQYRKLGYPMLKAYQVHRVCRKFDRLAQT